jgi:hypothetical protein
VHARGTTQWLERDVQHRVLPIGVLSVDTRLRLDDESKPSAESEEHLIDNRTEPIDSSNINTAEVGRTVIERMASTLQNDEPTEVVFCDGDDGIQSSMSAHERRTFSELGLADHDVSQTPFDVETTIVTIRRIDSLQPPTGVADELPSHVALVETHLIGTDSLLVDSAAEATVWIPLSDAEHSEYSHAALAEAVTHHAVEQYEWSAYRGETDDLNWHVWDPEEHGYIDAPAPTDSEDSSIARTHERPDRERLVCPITDTDAVGITRIRPCGVGIIEVSCHARLYRPSANRILGPVHDSRQALYAPLWTNVEWYSRQLVDSISGRADGLTPETLRLAQRT